jgi:hypothetical protein
MISKTSARFAKTVFVLLYYNSLVIEENIFRFLQLMLHLICNMPVTLPPFRGTYETYKISGALALTSPGN